MDLPRYVMFSGASLTLALTIAAGCGGSDTTGGGGAGGAGPMDLATVCKDVFSDQGSTCGDCLAKSCPKEEAACCMNPSCEPVTKCARGKACVGMDCYTSASMNGPCHSLIDDFGGPTGDPQKLATALTQCTITNNCKALCLK